MKVHPLLMASTLFFCEGNLTLEASEVEMFVGDAQDAVSSLKRTCRFSAKDPVDQAMYGTEGDFLVNVFRDARSNFGGRGYQGHQQDKEAMLEKLEEEGERLSKRRLYRGRDISPEYRAATYAILSQYQSQ